MVVTNSLHSSAIGLGSTSSQSSLYFHNRCRKTLGLVNRGPKTLKGSYSLAITLSTSRLVYDGLFEMDTLNTKLSWNGSQLMPNVFTVKSVPTENECSTSDENDLFKNSGELEDNL
ncbi:hypothetical protein AVEN_140628-1 [Araneus ventricosus]|uniref:Uncharacterized protein n=1 Tax=Araneus ventricosus TaxID=182803 RepID=A0A4Y2UC03_ARAVE|nr:hypothetical protein AVEN_140628-1 [Araneus ventricosus]